MTYIALLVRLGLIIVQLITGKLDFLPRGLLLAPVVLAIAATVALSSLAGIMARRG